MTVERRVAAAVEVARGHGVSVSAPRVLAASNNVVVQLAPAPLVAKVAATWRRRDQRRGRLARELAVARHAAGHGAPVVQPSVDPPAGPHRRDGYELTLWKLVEPARREADSAEIADALTAFHTAMADYPGQLPSFRSSLDEATDLLADTSCLPRLQADDRAVLVRTDRRIREALPAFSWHQRPLHGQPHEGNRFVTPSGVLLFDLEDACSGPLEWDLAYLPSEITTHFERVQLELLTLLRQAVSLCVAVWCWADPDRAPDVAEAAHVHVGILREAENRV